MREGLAAAAGLPQEQKPAKEKGRCSEKGEARKKKERKFLTTYCQNITEQAAMGKLDRVVGRERELNRVIQILCRRQKNNPCLIGEPGVGKTAIAEALAQKIVAGDVPYKLRGKEPVSYTHLDGYKRQHLYGKICSPSAAVREGIQ